MAIESSWHWSATVTTAYVCLISYRYVARRPHPTQQVVSRSPAILSKPYSVSRKQSSSDAVKPLTQYEVRSLLVEAFSHSVVEQVKCRVEKIMSDLHPCDKGRITLMQIYDANPHVTNVPEKREILMYYLLKCISAEDAAKLSVATWKKPWPEAEINAASVKLCTSFSVAAQTDFWFKEICKQPCAAVLFHILQLQPKLKRKDWQNPKVVSCLGHALLSLSDNKQTLQKLVTFTV